MFLMDAIVGSTLKGLGQSRLPDNEFLKTVDTQYGRMLSTLDETKRAYINQLKRQNLDYLIKKVEYDFSFSHTKEGERTKLLKLDT